MFHCLFDLAPSNGAILGSSRLFVNPLYGGINVNTYSEVGRFKYSFEKAYSVCPFHNKPTQSKVRALDADYLRTNRGCATDLL